MFNFADDDLDDDEAARAGETGPAPGGTLPAPLIARVRWLMIISGLTTLVAIAAVIAVIGYRVLRGGGNSAASAEAVVTLPRGARILSSSVADNRIAVTVEIGGATEIRIFDVKTLKEIGRLRFVTEP
jgi:hypothetical protein